MSPRLKTSIWVGAVIRSYATQGVPAVVARKGEPDAGTVLVKMNRFEHGCSVLSQARSGEGELVWMRAAAEGETECDAYIEKAVRRDPDLWVIEVEDRQGRQLFEGRVV